MPRKDKTEYNNYMSDYMREYRRLERAILKKAKREWGWNTPNKRNGGKN